MKREEVYTKLDEVFQDIFDDPLLHINDSTTAKDIDDWDSLEHINLCVAIEKKFDIKFNMGEINNFRNVGEMVDLIMQRI